MTRQNEIAAFKVMEQPHTQHNTSHGLERNQTSEPLLIAFITTALCHYAYTVHFNSDAYVCVRVCVCVCVCVQYCAPAHKHVCVA